MKTLITILSVLITSTTFSQSDCRASVNVNGYVDGKFIITITNLSKCVTGYKVYDNVGNKCPDSLIIKPSESKTLEWKIEKVCGRHLLIMPDEKCKLFNFLCELQPIVTEDVCSGTLAVKVPIFARKGEIGFRNDLLPSDVITAKFIYPSGRSEIVTPTLKQKGSSYWFFNY